MRRVLLLALAACGGVPPHVKLDAPWPAQPPAYDATRDRWTRHAETSEDFVRTVIASATLQSPEWRAAFVHERARRLRLPPDAEARDAETARAADTVDVELIVATAKPEWNDLHKGAKSMWRVALVADGREAVPVEVREDKRPRDELAAYVPDLHDFYRPYVVRFPAGSIAPGTKRVSLKLTAAVGAVELVWEGS